MTQIHYKAKIFRDFEMAWEIITLKAVTYGDAVDELETIINNNPLVLGGELI